MWLKTPDSNFTVKISVDAKASHNTFVSFI